MEGVHFTAGDGKGSSRGEFQSMAEVASLLGATEDQLTVLPYGETEEMVMVAETQFVDDAPANFTACMLLHRIHGLSLLVRGDVVCFPHGRPPGTVAAAS